MTTSKSTDTNEPIITSDVDSESEFNGFDTCEICHTTNPKEDIPKTFEVFVFGCTGFDCAYEEHADECKYKGQYLLHRKCAKQAGLIDEFESFVSKCCYFNPNGRGRKLL